MTTWANSSLTSLEQTKSFTDSRIPMIQEQVLRFNRVNDFVILRQITEDSRYSRHAVRWSLGRTVEANVEPLDDRVGALMSQGRVQAARDLASFIGGEWGELLAAPIVRPGQEAVDGEARFNRDQVWLDANRRNPAYKGRWVALARGQLLGADESRAALHRQLKHAGRLRGALFVRLV